MSTPYQPDPNQGQGSSYQPTQQYNAPQYGQNPQGQTPQYGQPQYGQNPQSGQPQWGQQGQQPPQYGAPQYGQQQPPQYGAPQYGQQQPPQYGAPQYGQPPQAPPYNAGYGQGAYGAMPTFANPERTPYLSGGPVGFVEAIQQGLKNAFVYEGRSSLSAYWWLALANFGATLVLFILALAAGNTGFIILVYLLSLASIIYMLPAAVRRLHDTGKSGLWFLIGFATLIGTIVLIVFLAQASTPGPNQYGNRVLPTATPRLHARAPAPYGSRRSGV
jgi:uncharacterized membrane protein YhaH (DUF805 family)